MAGTAEQTDPRAGPGDRQHRLARAAAAQQAGDRDAALALYTEALAETPDQPRAWTNLGVLFRAEGRHDKALMAQRRAYALDPRAVSVRSNLANILDDTGAHAEAAKLRSGLMDEHPDDPAQAALYVRSLRAGGDPAAALAAARTAQARFGDHPEVGLQLAMTLLMLGEYAEGFAAYQARWRTGQLELPKNRLPRWDGAALDGRRLLVIHEQGFGDTLCCARFLPDLARFGGTASVLSRPPTARLLQGVAGVQRVITGAARASDFDCWCPIMDLPEFHFRDGLALPPPASLHLPDASVLEKAALIKPFSDKVRVGANWTGSVTNDRNPMRSFGHDRLLALAGLPGVAMVSLYKGPRLQDYRDDGTAAFIPDIGGSDRDLADCAAAMTALDLVITADTVTAHIAGSLGIEVWVLLHWDGFWLWGTDPERTPWYPAMRLFRQTAPGDWDGVFQRVAAELAARVAGKRE